MKYIAATVGVLIISVLGYFAVAQRPASGPENKISVVASFYPIYFFASEIGGDKARVTNIMPDGAGPHDYEPTPQDMIKIESSDMLVLSGGVEEWGADLKSGIDPKKTLVVEASQGLRTQEFTEDGVTEEDPHVWLSPKLAIRMVDTIAQGFEAVSPENAAYYRANADALIGELKKLNAEYEQTLSQCKRRDFVGSHGAFGYLGTSYSIRPVSIAGLSPDAEPSPQKLAELADFAKQNDVKVIFFENGVSPKLSETIANEVGAQTMELSTLEHITTKEIAAGEDYLSIMRHNLGNLKIALECK